MKHKYLVIGPIGSILIKCQELSQTIEFIKYHCQQNKDAYQLLIGKKLKENDYKVIDLNDIITFKEWEAKIFMGVD